MEVKEIEFLQKYIHPGGKNGSFLGYKFKRYMEENYNFSKTIRLCEIVGRLSFFSVGQAKLD